MRSFTRFGLSPTQLLATALAAVTATVAASYLGVTGTVIGAALASVVSAIGTAVYSHSLHTTRARVREVVPPRRRPPSGAPGFAASTEAEGLARNSAPVRRERGRWQAATIGALTVFVTLLVVVTGVEMVTGRPLSDLVRGETGSGTTLFGGTRHASVDRPAPTVTQTVTPSVVVTTPTVTQTAPPVTETAAPTGTAAPTPTASPSTPASTPSPSVSPTG
jgi:hypothetical protein